MPLLHTLLHLPARIAYLALSITALGLLGFGWVIDKLGTKLSYGLAMAFWSGAAMLHALVGSVAGFAGARSLLGLGEARHGAVLSGCFQNGNNHFFRQFTTVKNIFQMLGNGRNAHAKQFRHAFLRQPDALVTEQHFHFDRTAGCGVEQELRGLIAQG
jgi:hypothetical protein